MVPALTILPQGAVLKEMINDISTKYKSNRKYSFLLTLLPAASAYFCEH